MKKILSLIEERIGSERRVKIWENDYYRIEFAKNKYTCNVNIHSNKDFVPPIYVKYNYNTGNIIEFEIGTTAYSQTSKEDIKAIIEGFEVALITVEQLEELLKNYIEEGEE